jgi:hypothetical protein
MRFATAFREAAWLDAERFRGYALLWALAYFVFLGAWALHDWFAPPSAGRPAAHDFVVFWSAAWLALRGHGAWAYNTARLITAENAAAVMPDGTLPFYYPPPFLLLCLPFGLMSYPTAMLVFIAGEMALLLALLRRILPRMAAWLPVLTWPGFLLAAMIGQNTPLTASCFAGAAIWLERRPMLAGMFLGGLVCKPQFLLGVPLALLAARRFSAFCAFALTAASLCLASWLVLGTDVWRAFLTWSPQAFARIQFDPTTWHKMQSAFCAMRLAGAGIGVAYAVQACFALGGLITILWVSAKRPGAGLEMSVLATASLLVSPYLYHYELAVLCVPAAWLAQQALSRGWRDWERLALLVIFLLPPAALACAENLGIIVSPVCLAAFLPLLAHRIAPAHRVRLQSEGA